MTGVILERGEMSSGDPLVYLSMNGRHIGTFWGTLKFPDNEFDRKYGVFHIWKGKEMLAVIWHVSAVEEGKGKYGTHRIKAGE